MLKKYYFLGREYLRRNLLKPLWILLIGLALSTAIGAFLPVAAHSATSPQPTSPQLWVLDNNNSYPNSIGTLTAILSDGTENLVRNNLNTSQTIGAWRAITVNPDGQTSWVALFGFGTNKLSKIAIDGTELASVTGADYTTVDVGLKSGHVYALDGGTIYGNNITIFDQQGNLVLQNHVGGLDLVVDEANDSVWIVGDQIRRLGLDLNAKFTPIPLGYAAVSVDYASDGTAWVAVQDNVQNKLMHIALDGTILSDSVDLSFLPFCVRADRTTGSVWIAGFGGPYKYIPSNTTLIPIADSDISWSVAVDYNSGLIWVGYLSGTVKSFSNSGVPQAQITGFSSDQKWVATQPPIFYEDFNEDTAGSFPNSPAVGTFGLSCDVSQTPAPYGDCPSKYSSIFVQDTPAGGFSTKSLKLDKGASAGNSPTFRAYPLGSPLTTGTYTFTWKASRMVDLATSVPMFIAAVSDLGGPSAFVINYNSDGTIVYQDSLHNQGSSSSPYFNSTSVHFTKNVPNTFHAVVNLDLKTFDLYIDGQQVASQKGFLSSSFQNAVNLNIEIGGIDNDTYAIDDVQIFSGAIPPSPPPITNYTLTYNTDGNGTISPSTLQIQSVPSGSSGTTVTAVPNTGYSFTNWSDGVLTAFRTDTNVKGNISVTANFAINTYTLTYAAGLNGWISGATSQVVTYGNSGLSVKVVPIPGYYFVNWTLGGSTDNPRTDTNVTANISVTANFAPIDNTILLTTANPPGGTYNSNQEVSLVEIYSSATNIFYTTNGTDPIAGAGPVYTYNGPFQISTNTTLKFAAKNGTTSETPVKTEVYTFDSNLTGTLTQPPATPINGNIPVTVTFSNVNIPNTIKPDCFNTFFELIGPDGKLLPSLCRIRKAYGPSDVGSIKNGDTLTCNLGDMYDPSILNQLAAGSYTVKATYSNYIPINPNLDGSTLWTGAIDSAPTTITLYNFTGFFFPAFNQPPVLNNVIAGLPVPIWWQIKGPKGVWISDPSSVINITAKYISCGKTSPSTTAIPDIYDKGAPGLQYLGFGIWLYNWKTAKGYSNQCVEITLNLNDGTKHTADFQFK